MAEELTRSQVEEIVEFAQGLALAQNIYYNGKDGFYSPFMQNQQLNKLNNNPLVPSSYEKIETALAQYVENGIVLQGFTEFMQKWDMIFARTLRSYSDILSFDLQIVPQGEYTTEELNSPEFLEDKKRIYRFLDAFDYKNEFHKMCVEVMRHEIVYTWLRKTKWNNQGMKGTLQIMPQKYCMLTGYWEKGMLYDFDMNYFLNPGVDIDGFDPIFKKYYKEMFLDGEFNNYIPTSTLENRNGAYALWHQTSPEDGAWAKFNNSR